MLDLARLWCCMLLVVFLKIVHEAEIWKQEAQNGKEN